MKNPKVSIIISCFNLGQYLDEAISSIYLYGNKEDFEIILVNDGSTDQITNQIIKKISIENPDILILNQENLGLAKARNNGIKLANTNIIIPLDADNKLRPEFIEKAIQKFETNQQIGVLHGDAQFFGEKDTVWVSKNFIFSEMIQNNYIDACAAFRKTIWQNLGGYDENMPEMGFEDWDLWLRIANQGYEFEYCPTVFFDYRVRKNSMLSSAWLKRDDLINYMFAKPELKHLLDYRNCILENKVLKREPSTKSILNILLKKVKRKLFE